MDLLSPAKVVVVQARKPPPGQRTLLDLPADCWLNLCLGPSFDSDFLCHPGSPHSMTTTGIPALHHGWHRLWSCPPCLASFRFWFLCSSKCVYCSDFTHQPRGVPAASQVDHCPPNPRGYPPTGRYLLCAGYRCSCSATLPSIASCPSPPLISCSPTPISPIFPPSPSSMNSSFSSSLELYGGQSSGFGAGLNGSPSSRFQVCLVGAFDSISSSGGAVPSCSPVPNASSLSSSNLRPVEQRSSPDIAYFRPQCLWTAQLGHLFDLPIDIKRQRSNWKSVRCMLSVDTTKA